MANRGGRKQALDSHRPRQRDLVAMRQIAERLRQLRTQFVATHERGLAALNARDYAAFGVVIAREQRIIRRQHALLQQSRAIICRTLI